MDILRVRVMARGFVQGVGYRAFVRRYARTLGVTGYARNLGDGSVEVVGEGPRDALDPFLAAVRRGSPSGRVDAVEVTWEPATDEYSAFMIR